MKCKLVNTDEPQIVAVFCERGVGGEDNPVLENITDGTHGDVWLAGRERSVTTTTTILYRGRIVADRRTEFENVSTFWTILFCF